MIGTMEVTSGFAAKLERLKKPIEFKLGLNILFGPNGCGKSTALKIAAAYCGIDCSHQMATGGWSKIVEPKYGSKNEYPNRFSVLAPGKEKDKCKAKLEWDGTPTLLADSATSDCTNFTHLFYDEKDSPDGMTSLNEQLAIMWGHPSSGQMRMAKLKKYFDALKNPPVINEFPKKWKNYNSEWKKAAQSFLDYVNGLPRGGPVTFMLDEPDRSFSVENQMLFWTRLIPQVIQKYQVIIATHSVFSLIYQNANWIEFEPGIVERSRKALDCLK